MFAYDVMFDVIVDILIAVKGSYESLHKSKQK